MGLYFLTFEVKSINIHSTQLKQRVNFLNVFQPSTKMLDYPKYVVHHAC